LKSRRWLLREKHERCRKRDKEKNESSNDKHDGTILPKSAGRRGSAKSSSLADSSFRRFGEETVWLVWHTNESAIRFYERVGAHSVDTVRFMRIDM